MLAEIYILKLEAAKRAAGTADQSRNAQFVPSPSVVPAPGDGGFDIVDAVPPKPAA